MKLSPAIAHSHYKRYRRKYSKLLLDNSASSKKLEFLRKRILRLKEFLNSILLKTKLAAAVGTFGLVLSANNASAQSFGAVSVNPFGLTNIINRTAPAFVDIDNDGDFDIISGDYSGKFKYFKNTGTASVPVYAAVVTNPFGLTDIGSNSTPTFIDLDNDGDLDLMVGESTGNFKYFQNTGTASAPAFAAVVTNPFSLADIGKYSAPTFVDIDNDGDFDLISGEYYGNFKYFKNTGTASAPAFAAAITNPFGLANVSYLSFATCIDLDLDGDLDLVAGHLYGDFEYFQNTGTASAPIFAAAVTDPFGLTDIGYSSAPVFADLDNDGDMDLLSGDYYGDFYYFVNTCAAVALATPGAIVGSTPICSNSVNTYSIASVAGATSYDWKKPSGWSGASITNTISTTASSNSGLVKVTAKNSCRSRTVSKSITVNPTPTITVGSGSICIGSSYTMVPGGGVSYTYSSGSSIVTPTVTSSFTVTGASASGCTNTAVSTVTVNAPAITVSSGTICIGDTYTMVPGGGVSYTFSSGSAIVSPTITTSYTVTGTAVSGCTNTAVSLVTVGVPTITVNSGSICAGNSFTLNPIGAVSYTYEGGSAVVTPTATKTYTVIGSSLSGCVSSAVTSTVTVVANPTITVNSGTICSGQSFTMNPIGALSYTYQGGSAIVSPLSLSTYTVIGSNSGCLSSIVTSTVTVNTTPTITVNSGTICSGNSFTMVPSGAGAISFTYAGGSAVVSPTVTKTYTVIGSSAAGCVSSAVTSTVTVNTTPTITVNSGTICSGQSFTMNPLGALSYTYEGGSAIVSPTISTTYTVIGSSAAGCVSSSVTSSLTVNTTPTITVNSGSLCVGQSFTMNPSGAPSFTYEGGSAVVSPTITSTYTVNGTSSAGCVSADVTSTVTVFSIPTLTVNNGSICSGQSFTMYPASAVSFTYSGGSAVVNPYVSTNYTITGANAAGCTNTVVSMVNVSPSPTITAICSPTAICTGEVASITVTGASSYIWNTGETTSVITNTFYTSAFYSVVGTDDNGCRDTANVDVVVSQCTGIASQNSNLEFSLYPNPSKDEFTIILTNGLEKTIEIINVTGKTVYTQQSFEDKIAIDIRQLSSGVYLVKVTSDGRQQTLKFIKE